jgi:hypothetical protein
MLAPLFTTQKQLIPMKNRFAPELTRYGKNRWKYIYCPVAGNNAAVIITGVHPFCS